MCGLSFAADLNNLHSHLRISCPASAPLFISSLCTSTVALYSAIKRDLQWLSADPCFLQQRFRGLEEDKSTFPSQKFRAELFPLLLAGDATCLLHCLLLCPVNRISHLVSPLILSDWGNIFVLFKGEPTQK